MTFLNIPEELRELDQWVVWRAVNRGKGTTKIPFNAYNPSEVADPVNPATWSDFATALKACNRNPQLGLGFVFSENDPYIGIDIDDLGKVAEDLRDNRSKLAGHFLRGASYTESSPSGKGHHIICRGSLGKSSAHVVRAMQIEVYAHSRFFTMTGKIEHATPISDMQEDLDGFCRAFPKSDISEYEEVELIETVANGRRVDMSDEEVFNFALNNINGFHNRYHGIEINDWSAEHRNLVGDFDKITGDPEQVKRLVFNSPLVQNQPPKNGETRPHKSMRLFAQHLGEVRAVYAQAETGYRNNPMFIAHGRILAEAALASFAHRREQEAQRAAEVMEALRKQEEEGGISKNGASLLHDFEKYIGLENLVLTRPPGVAGEFVEANEKGSYHPYTKYAIPSTLAVLSGIIGRKYKVDNSGLNINFLLAAESGTGKTDHGKAWETFIAQSIERMSQTRMIPFPGRIIKGAAASVQGIGDQLHAMPAVAWFVDEAYQMVRNMTDEKSPTGTQLRNSFNEMYDASSFDSLFKLPASRKSNEVSTTGIPNLNVSTYWTMTPEEFDNFTGSVSNGFMSRMLIIRETETYGLRQKHPNLNMPVHLQQRLDAIMGNATLFDEMYSENKEKWMIRQQLQQIIMDPEADALYEQIADLIDATKRKALKGEVPKDYMMVNRIPVNAKKIAGLLAAIEQPYAPVINTMQLKWAVGYIVQNIVMFLSEVDRGELGLGSSDEVQAIIRFFKTLLKKHKGAQGIGRKELHEFAKGRKPFRGNERGSASLMVTNTIEHMIKEEIFMTVEATRDGPGRPTTLLVPGDHPIWGS
ncbi:DNA primase protein [Rhizobium phage RHph_N17]|nr:DNA primase protein [Rhizobium phage RHph_N17]